MKSYIYDKAKYHYEGDFPKDLPAYQAYIHTGMFLGWIVDNELYSDLFRTESEKLIAAFKARKISGPQLYQEWDGTLSSEMLSKKGNQFARGYFDFEKGGYLKDYWQHLAQHFLTVYHVEDSWENYEKIREAIDLAYQAWETRK